MRPECRPAGDAAEAGSCSKAIPRCPAKGERFCTSVLGNRGAGPAGAGSRASPLACPLPPAPLPPLSLVHGVLDTRSRGHDSECPCTSPAPSARSRRRDRQHKAAPGTTISGTKRAPAAAILGHERRRAVAADRNGGRHEEIVYPRRL